MTQKVAFLIFKCFFFFVKEEEISFYINVFGECRGKSERNKRKKGQLTTNQFFFYNTKGSVGFTMSTKMALTTCRLVSHCDHVGLWNWSESAEACSFVILYSIAVVKLKFTKKYIYGFNTSKEKKLRVRKPFFILQKCFPWECQLFKFLEYF